VRFTEIGIALRIWFGTRRQRAKVKSTPSQECRQCAAPRGRSFYCQLPQHKESLSYAALANAQIKTAVSIP
jgi:hypothetical protein